MRRVVDIDGDAITAKPSPSFGPGHVYIRIEQDDDECAVVLTHAAVREPIEGLTRLLGESPDAVAG